MLTAAGPLTQVMDSDELSRGNLAQILVECIDPANGPVVTPLTTVDAAFLSCLEIRLPTGKRILLDFTEGEIVVEDLDTGDLVVVDESTIVYTGFGR